MLSTPSTNYTNVVEDSTKPYSLTYVEHTDYLHAIIQARTITRKIALSYLREVAHKCIQSGHQRLLLERNVPMTIPLVDIFFTTTDFLHMMGNSRVALVNPYSELDAEMNFIVTVARNRGGLFSLHSSVQSAENWLLRDRRPSDLRATSRTQPTSN